LVYQRLGSTALEYNKLSELVEITHPFHPLRGKRYPLVKSKKWKRRDLLSLALPEGGTICVARDWTDRADPELYTTGKPPELCFERLVELRELVVERREKKGD